MEFGAVTLVLAETIFRETRAEVAHNRIARDLGDDARRRDAQAVAIAVYYCRLRERERKNRKPVDEDMLRLHGQGGDGRAHSFVSSAQDIDRVDLNGIDYAHRPCNGVVTHQVVVNFLALFRQELLGIVELPVFEFFRENNGGGYDWARERAAPGFVDTSDGGDP